MIKHDRILKLQSQHTDGMATIACVVRAEGHRHLTIVIDTNVLVEKLSLLQQICAVFLELQQRGDKNIAALVVIPSIVLAELDGLKRVSADGAPSCCLHAS